MSRLLFAIICTLACFQVLNAKVAEGTIPLTKGTPVNWKYMAKFGYSYGVGDYEVRFRFNSKSTEGFSQTPVTFNVYLDDRWSSVVDQSECHQKVSHASVSYTAKVPNTGEWSEWVRGKVQQWQRPHVWFFGFSDCNNALSAELGDIKYEVHMINSDSSEFSVEEQGFGLPYLGIMAYMALFIIFNLTRLQQIYKREEEIDYAFVALIVSMVIELVALVFESIHISVYALDGRGVATFDFLSQTCSIFSQFIMTCLLVLISWGWTLSFQGLKEWYCYLPIGLIIGFLQITMVGLNHFSQDDVSKYHDYDNWAGLLVVMIRVGLFGYFTNGIRETSTKSCRESVKGFVTKFGILGSFYLLAFPLLVLITMVSAPYVRHRIVTIGTIITQTLGMAFLAYSFTNKNSEYHKASVRGRGILPDLKFHKLE